MITIRSGEPADKPSPDTGEIEAEIRKFVRKLPRDSVEKKSAGFPYEVSDTIRRVAVRSTEEIDRLISELTELRERLQRDSNRVQGEIVRVQCEIAGYTLTSDAAIQSIREIDQSLGQFKRAVAPSPVN